MDIIYLKIVVYESTDQEPTETSKQPIRTRYLGHVTSYQPIRDQYFLTRSVPDTYIHQTLLRSRNIAHSKTRNVTLPPSNAVRALVIGLTAATWGSRHVYIM
eukprot:sb/3478409/